MAGNHERNTAGLTKSREKRARECQERVEKAIQQLIKEKGKITFNSVAERATISKAYLYTHTDVRERIDTLRKYQEGLPSPKQMKREMTDASKDVLLAAKNKRIRELEEEVKQVKDILKRRYGEDYEKGM